ncbi:uncharacterized protein MELLADRAFT_108678 [Melampsora larici-populina 98AG31]|uniref:Uncharacterized protein n=1 Tax=Melampsora larici-populina (strain 98AG31 / pathotype 3-4-7) TaxID=747676 RepID=F4RTW1_MELLP|nr:uncharacterized protein MELLADRAFT_108678 [Melampsora larici-populina 98AG31]EGG04072.1 hypothetical protein MELLADRAFT_108678 [Melampsora larici-populina 98AG31]
MTDPKKTTPYQRTGSEFSQGASALLTKRPRKLISFQHILANFEVATYSLAHALVIGFWGSAQLQPQIDVEVQIVTQVRKQSAIGSVFASVALTAMENLVHCLDKDNNPTQLIGHLLDPGAYETLKELHMHNLQWTSFHMILDLLFERPIWPIFNNLQVRDASLGVLCKSGIGSIEPHLPMKGISLTDCNYFTAQNITCQFLVFCAICKGIRNGENRMVASSEAVKFKVMTIFLKAIKLLTTSKSKDLCEIINAFDKKIYLASKHKLFLLEGLACKMLCNYIENFRVQASRLAYGYRLLAYRAYQSCGTKCQDMKRKHKVRLPRHSEYSPMALCVTSNRNISALTKTTSPDLNEQSKKPPVSNSASPHLGLPVIPEMPSTLTTMEQSTGNLSHPSNTSQRVFNNSETTKQNFDVAALLAASHTWQT